MPRLNSTCIIGFDSAWANKSPGAVCALTWDVDGKVDFMPPQQAHFNEALVFIRDRQDQYDLCVVAVDQPTIVPNKSGCRPVDRVAGAVIGYMGGGVQPAHRMKKGIFDEGAPFWSFKASLGARECPETTRTAESGLFVIEVFPALALPGLNGAFYGRLKGPKYNPAKRKRFRFEDWLAVIETVRRFARAAGIEGVELWAKQVEQKCSPTKADQDCLDALICSLTGYQWRASPRDYSILIGDLASGYMIAPTNEKLTEHIKRAAEKLGVPSL